MKTYKDIITVEAGKRGGRPCIRGMRITVYDVLGYLAAGMTQDDILSDFPYLTKDDIQLIRICSKCGHVTESYGTSDRSVRRCLMLMCEECPEDEDNFSVEE